MLMLPTVGMIYSVDAHNVKLDVLCDWIECSVLFDREEVSKNDIVDVLLEENIYVSSDMAAIRLTDAWAELRLRSRLTGVASPFEVEERRVSRRKEWREVPGHSLCLLLSYAKWNRAWADQFGSNYTTQGELFEELTKESVKRLFDGWDVFITGWSRTHVQSLTTVVRDIARRLDETVGNLERWTTNNAKDAGLDVLFYRSFGDKRVGIPVFMVQCASGGNWREKLRTPDLVLWRHLVDFAAMPTRAFATPFALPIDEFHQHCAAVNGLMLDRYRLLSAGASVNPWVSEELKTRINNWATPRVDALPKR